MPKVTSRSTRKRVSGRKAAPRKKNRRAGGNGREKVNGKRGAGAVAAKRGTPDAADSPRIGRQGQTPPDDAAEDPVLTVTGNDDHIDDPVRIYLMQMGEIPLLTRREEIAAAKRIERSRGRFRHAVLSTDYILQAAIGLLQKIRDGRLRLDRTVEVSVTNVREKRHIMGLLDPNLRTLRDLLTRNQADFRIAISKRRPKRQRRQAWRRLVCRRNKAVRLIEEVGLRTQRLHPPLAQLKEISRRMDVLSAELVQLRRSRRRIIGGPGSGMAIPEPVPAA